MSSSWRPGFCAPWVPAADKAGIKLACHPHDPAYPFGGLNGVAHVLGSIEGMRRFVALSSSPNHGLNFRLGTVAEMATEPYAYAMRAIAEFAPRIFMVHFPFGGTQAAPMYRWAPSLASFCR